MSGLYRSVFDHALTRIDPEVAHHRAFGTWRALNRVPGFTGGVRRVLGGEALGPEVFGHHLRSPLGLAAGFDKDALGVDALGALGFGFVEIGTVTGEAQPGNPKPRLARLPKDRAIVNRMGFNNDGSAVVAARLARRADAIRRGDADGGVMLGVNIGKTKVVPADEAVADYRRSAGRLAPYADYLVVNVSSPNTAGLRDLQAVDALEPILRAVAEAADEAAGRQVPLLVKIAPDLADDDVRATAGLASRLGLAGVVATNTTIAREGLRSAPAEIDAAGGGGLSGPVLAERSSQVLALLRAEMGAEPVIISVGGITTPQDAIDRLEAGATLVQAYTAFIYEGPLWVRRVNAAIAAHQRQES